MQRLAFPIALLTVEMSGVGDGLSACATPEDLPMKTQIKTRPALFKKQYSLAIDTGPWPENPDERVRLAVEQVSPVINQIIKDAMTVAIGTWPTPE